MKNIQRGELGPFGTVTALGGSVWKSFAIVMSWYAALILEADTPVAWVPSQNSGVCCKSVRKSLLVIFKGPKILTLQFGQLLVLAKKVVRPEYAWVTAWLALGDSGGHC